MTSHFLWASRTTPLHKQGQELRSEQTAINIHEQDHLYLFLRLNNSETFVENIAIVCGLLQGASGWRTLFFVLPYFPLFRSSFFVAHRL